MYQTKVNTLSDSPTPCIPCPPWLKFKFSVPICCLDAKGRGRLRV